jgi:hypothetical protein
MYYAYFGMRKTESSTGLEPSSGRASEIRSARRDEIVDRAGSPEMAAYDELEFP